MRIVVAAANGQFAAPAVHALLADHTLVAVLRPARTAWRRLRRALFGARSGGDALTSLATEGGVREYAMSSDDARASALLGSLRPDVVIIVTFPWMFGPLALSAPRLGTLNVHPSLLPRHRGPNPYFWQYYHEDAEGGLSIHAATSRADAGPVWVQSRVAIARGYPVQSLHDALASRAVHDLPLALRKLEGGGESPVDQDESLASPAPRVESVGRMVDFETWSTPRVWHLLKGMFPRYTERLHDSRGGLVRYGGVRGWEGARHSRPVGSVTGGADGWTLWCRDGLVELAP